MPSERKVWLMSKRACDDGHKINQKVMRAFESGELVYMDHQFYKFCRGCGQYYTLDHFYSNKRYVMEVGYICKSCTATRRRLKKYCVASYITDTGMKDPMEGVRLSISEENSKILKGGL